MTVILEPHSSLMALKDKNSFSVSLQHQTEKQHSTPWDRNALAQLSLSTV